MIFQFFFLFFIFGPEKLPFMPLSDLFFGKNKTWHIQTNGQKKNNKKTRKQPCFFLLFEFFLAMRFYFNTRKIPMNKPSKFNQYLSKQASLLEKLTNNIYLLLS